MLNGFNVALAAAAVLVVGVCIWRAAHPQLDPEALDPIAIPVLGWRFAFECLASCWKQVLSLALLIVTSSGLQAFFTYVPVTIEGELVLPIASAVWQGLLATLMAALIAPVHLFVISRIAGAPLGTAFGVRRSSWRLAMLSAAYGFAIWFAAYALGVAFKTLVVFTPGRWNLVIGLVTTAMSFLLVALLTLVRPALSMGAVAPLRAGMRIALRNPIWLWLVTGLLLLPPFVIVPIMAFIPRAPTMLGPGADAQALTIVLATFFSLFQFLAVEAATVTFCRRAVKPIAEAP